MAEIGGYIEFEHYRGNMLHDSAIKLDSGRNCFAYLIKAKGIRKVLLPSYMCDSVFNVCNTYHVQIEFYRVNRDFLPELPDRIEEDENTYLYLMNYYGQLSSRQIAGFLNKYKRVIVDNAQAYFDEPLPCVDTIYTCRKFFGVPDGALLYTDAVLEEELEQAESFQHLTHLVGRFERNASEFFEESIKNNERLTDYPIRKMSKLTENLLRAVDYDYAMQQRTNNFVTLHKELQSINKLNLKITEGAFAYPFLISCGDKLKKHLITNNVYVPTLWPNVVKSSAPESLDYQLSMNLLPIPCDHRYGDDEMRTIIELIMDFVTNEES